MSLGGPCLDPLADGVPCRIDGALRDAAAHGSLVDHFALRELAVEFGLHDVGPLLLGFVERHVALDCLNLDTHK